jgi:hypothetical protein
VFSKIVAPGGKTYIDIDIKLPEVNKITKLILSAKVKGTSDSKIDSLSINVYPKKISTNGVTSFALYDPIGKTAQKFKSLGLSFVEVKNVSDVKSGLLVIGSCAITSNLFADVKDNVKNGKINLLSMVQTQEALKGLGVVSKNIYAREAFYSDGKTVGPWAGIGKMSPHKAPPSPETEKRMPSPFFHWNNQNVICSCPILRPKNGAYEALLTCGKDLVYAPVIKVECGKGQIVFCQLEIEDRTKADPQADNLLIDVLSFSSRPKEKKMFARVANLGEAAKYGVTVEDASVQMFDIAPLGENLFSSFSKRDRFFRKPMALKTFSGEGVTPLFEPAFAAVKEVNGQKIVFLGVSENLLDDEFKLAEKAGEKSSILWAAETQEGRFNLIRSILETACGVEHDFPSFDWKSQYNTETHIRW